METQRHTRCMNAHRHVSAARLPSDRSVLVGILCVSCWRRRDVLSAVFFFSSESQRGLVCHWPLFRVRQKKIKPFDGEAITVSRGHDSCCQSTQHTSQSPHWLMHTVCGDVLGICAHKHVTSNVLCYYWMWKCTLWSLKHLGEKNHTKTYN